MSLTTTSIPTTQTSNPGCGSTLYEIPINDVACAMPYGGNHTDVMAACCESVVSYLDNCGLYCLAQGQNIGDLTQCLYDHGASYTDVFCNDPAANATATATGSTEPTASGASIVAGASSTSGSDSGSSGDDSSDNDDSAAVSVKGASGAGLMVGALLFSSFFLGIFQI